MKVLLSVGLGAWAFGPQGASAFWRFVDHAEALGLDSIWLSDRVVTPPASQGMVLEPMIALAGVAARTRRLKLGTSIYVLPLRNPVVAAKELATLDWLSDGRLLLAVGVGDEDERAYRACGIPKAERGARLDEALPLLRQLWSGKPVTHRGRFFDLEEITVEPRPPGPMPIWLGGRSEVAFRRIGHLCDGWLPSFITPQEVADGIERIQEHAREAGREIEEDHFGATLQFRVAPTREQALREARPHLLDRRPGTLPESVAVLGSMDDCLETVDRYVRAGASKFVLRPVGPPDSLLEQLDALATMQGVLG